MNRRANAIVGCSCFGLDDVTATGQGHTQSAGFFLADAVLPGRLHGNIGTGIRAENIRIHSGLPWPPEAQVKRGMPLRRAPIPCVWRSLVEARDEQARWKVGKGISFPCARIIAAHLQEALESLREERISPVLAIPNDLDELGQENLLHELDRLGFPDTRLIWRPIASALTWLEEAGQDIVPQRLGSDDFILVLHLGPDAIECTSFGIKTEKYDGLHYVLPRRKRPKSASDLAGFDWACCALEQLQSIPPEGVAEFWQAFTAFPEIWQCLANLEWQKDELPRIWGRSQNWDFWDPNREELIEAVRTVHCGPSSLLLRVLSQSCQLSGTKSTEQTWPEQLQQLVLKCLEHAPSGKLRGMIVDGPLAFSSAPLWLQRCFAQLRERGLDTTGPYGSPTLEKLWCCPGNSAIARGAAIFGSRLKTGQPTYLDTLPQLSLLAEKDNALKLFALVDVEDVRGGEEYTNSIERQFMIKADQPQLDVILYRGSPDADWLTFASTADRLDSHICTAAPGLTLGASSMARHLVRCLSATQSALNSLRTRPLRELSRAEHYQLRELSDQKEKIRRAQKDLCRDHGPVMVEYLRSYKSLYKGEGEKDSNAEKTHTSLKKVSSPFPLPPPRTMPVEIKVRISPASGRAKMEVIPEDSSFLRGRHVFVDYSTMGDLQELPSNGQGWPSLEEMTPHSEQFLWSTNRSIGERFLNTSPDSSLLYEPLLDRIYVLLMNRPLLDDYGIRFFTLNQNGDAGCDMGTEIVKTISAAVERHAESLLPHDPGTARGTRRTGTITVPRDKKKLLQRLIVRGSWLMGATPEALLKPMRYVLQNRLRGLTWGFVVDAAGRAFSNNHDLVILFEAVVHRTKHNHHLPLPMQSINAISRALMYRPNGQDVLDDVMADTLVRETLKVLDEHALEQRFKKKFFQGLRLLLYLLRYRKRQPGFLDKESEEGRKLLGKLNNYRNDINHVLTGARRAAAVEIMDGIKDFVNFAGSTATLELLTAMAEEEE